MWIRHDVNQVCDLSAPIPSGDPYFTNYAVTGLVSQLTAPVGTASVRYRFAYLQAGKQGGSCYLDDAVLDQIAGPIPPVISDLLPLNMIFVNPADGISFTASFSQRLRDRRPQASARGQRPGCLRRTGDHRFGFRQNVLYSGLASNLTYTASITSRTSSASPPPPRPGSRPTGSIFRPFFTCGKLRISISRVASISTIPTSATQRQPQLLLRHRRQWKASTNTKPVAATTTSIARMTPSPSVSREIGLRPHLHAAGRSDYRIDPFLGGEWLNYTRDWTNGTYWVFARLATEVGFSGSLTLSAVNPDTTTTDLGAFTVDSGQGWTSYENVPLRDTNGNYAAVTLGRKSHPPRHQRRQSAPELLHARRRRAGPAGDQ